MRQYSASKEFTCIPSSTRASNEIRRDVAKSVREDGVATAAKILDNLRDRSTGRFFKIPADRDFPVDFWQSPNGKDERISGFYRAAGLVVDNMCFIIERLDILLQLKFTKIENISAKNSLRY